MMKAVTLVLAGVSALALTVQPALADRGWDRHDRWDRHEGWDRGRGHYKHYPPRSSSIVFYSGPRYVTREVYVNQSSYPSYAQSSYSQIRCTNSANPLGLLLGGAAGGLLGHQVGKGDGRVVATIGGAVLGSALGGQALSQRCSEEVFTSAPVGTPISWQNYTVTPMADTRLAGRYCREYQAVATVGGRHQQTYGTACMQPDGSWEVVN